MWPSGCQTSHHLIESPSKERVNTSVPHTHSFSLLRVTASVRCGGAPPPPQTSQGHTLGCCAHGAFPAECQAWSFSHRAGAASILQMAKLRLRPRAQAYTGSRWSRGDADLGLLLLGAELLPLLCGLLSLLCGIQQGAWAPGRGGLVVPVSSLCEFPQWEQCPLTNTMFLSS